MGSKKVQSSYGDPVVNKITISETPDQGRRVMHVTVEVRLKVRVQATLVAREQGGLKGAVNI